jgi:hypothetical protein
LLKLYRFTNGRKEYWETWADDVGTHTVHWGALGTKGETKTFKSTLLRKAETSIQKEIDRLMTEGFHPIAAENHATLMVEYAIEDMGTTPDLDKRHRLEERMNETLGWTGLGACDGGSIGSGTMEVCNFVVDFELAKAVIAKDLAGTEFRNFTRIYDEDANADG